MRCAPLVASIVIALLSAPAFAKLPPLGDDAKAKVAETVAKAAWTDKDGGYKLCLVTNRVVETHRTRTKAAGKEAPAAIETPACADPGAYVAAAAAPTPPIEAAGAHSPPATATAPPSSKATAAELQGQVKK